MLAGRVGHLHRVWVVEGDLDVGPAEAVAGKRRGHRALVEPPGLVTLVDLLLEVGGVLGADVLAGDRRPRCRYVAGRRLFAVVGRRGREWSQ